MDEFTGGAAALFVEAFLDGDVRGPGVVAPEQAIPLERFLPRSPRAHRTRDRAWLVVGQLDYTVSGGQGSA